MRRSIIISCLLALFNAGVGHGQQNWRIDQLLKLADDYYSNFLYDQALNYYQEAESFDSENYYAMYKIAECYRQLFRYDEAGNYYNKVANSAAPAFPAAHFYQALMLKRNGDYEKSNQEFVKFLEEAKSKDELILLAQRSEVEMAGNNFAIDNFDAEVISNLGSIINFGNLTNTPYNDYGIFAVESDNSLLISSGKLNGTYNRYGRFGESYSDFYEVALIDGKWESFELDRELKIWNSRWSEGSGWMNKDKNHFYFTRCPEVNQKATCKIYLSERISEVWSEPAALNDHVNIEGWDSKHPSVTKNMDTLFFASNRPGGFGQYDIYMSIVDDTGNWGPAVNLGSGVNTSENEISPFFDDLTKSFYFASSGHLNMGGVDLFRIKGTNFVENDVENLGPPINSAGDDFYLSIGGQMAFLSSNREGGIGKFDAYFMDISLLDRDRYIVKKNRLITSRRRVSRRSHLYVSNNEDQLVYEELSSTDQVEINQYINEFIQQTGGDKTIKSYENFFYENIYFDVGTFALSKEGQLSLHHLTEMIQTNPDAIIYIKGYTDKIGELNYNRNLSGQRAMAAKEYLISLGLPGSSIETQGGGIYAPLQGSDLSLTKQLSRKIEINISSKQFIVPKYDTYITLVELSVEELSSLTGMSIDELKMLNGITESSIKVSRPIRLRKGLNVNLLKALIREKDLVD